MIVTTTTMLMLMLMMLTMLMMMKETRMHEQSAKLVLCVKVVVSPSAFKCLGNDQRPEKRVKNVKRSR